MLRNYKIPNLTNGVSQQPSSLKYSSQAELQVNAYSDPTKGLTKRPSTQLLGYPNGNTFNQSTNTNYPDGIFNHFIDRSDTEKYCLFVNGTGVASAFNLVKDSGTGVVTSSTITYATGQQSDIEAYLDTTTGNDAGGKIRALSVLDYTFLVNTNKAVSFSEDISTAGDELNVSKHEWDEGGTTVKGDEVLLLWVRQGDYEKKYSVHLNGTEYSYTSGKSVSGQNQQAKAADSSNIAQGLVSGATTDATNAADPNVDLDSGTGLSNAITAGDATSISRTGNLIVIKKTGGWTSVKVEDGLAGAGLKLIYKSVDKISDLPATAPKGFKTKIHGNVDGDEDDYYVEFQTNDESLADGTVAEGTWSECLGWQTDTNTENKVRKAFTSSSNLPVVIKSTGLNTFELSQISLEPRTVGTEETNKTPSFVGKTINNLFFFKDRLGFLSGDRIIMSEVGNHYNFFRNTVRVSRDDEPIDIGISSKSIVNAEHAIPYDNKLIVFAKDAQFTLQSGDVLTAARVSITQSSDYEMDTSIIPMTLDNQVYFGFKRKNYMGLYEYFVTNDNNKFEAVDITEHVPSYAFNSSTSIKITGCSKEKVIAVLDNSDEESNQYCDGQSCENRPNRNIIKVYKYFWRGRDKIQSAWFEFKLSRYIDILGIEFIGSELMIVGKQNKSGTRSTALVALKMDLSEIKDDNPTKNFHLDHLIESSNLTNLGGSITYDSNTDKTLYILPTNFLSDLSLKVLKQETSAYKEMGATSVFGSSDRFELSGNTVSSSFYIGYAFDTTYKMSIPYLKDSGQQGKNIVMSVKNRLKRGRVAYENTGYFKITIDNKGRTYDSATEFLGTTLGNINSQNLEYPPIISEGIYSFPILGNANDVKITIFSDSYLPFQLISMELEAFLNAHSTRTNY